MNENTGKIDRCEFNLSLITALLNLYQGDGLKIVSDLSNPENDKDQSERGTVSGRHFNVQNGVTTMKWFTTFNRGDSACISC